MSGLQGKYTVSLDPKGRLAIPSRHRNVFPGDQHDKIIITRGVDACVTGYYQEKWEEFEQRIESMDRSYIEKVTMRREFIGRSVEAIFDKQGRVTIPADLVEFAKLKDCAEVFVMGCGGYIEIWNPEIYNSRHDQNEDIVQRVMGEINM